QQKAGLDIRHVVSCPINRYSDFALHRASSYAAKTVAMARLAKAPSSCFLYSADACTSELGETTDTTSSENRPASALLILIPASRSSTVRSLRGVSLIPIAATRASSKFETPRLTETGWRARSRRSGAPLPRRPIHPAVESEIRLRRRSRSAAGNSSERRQ